MIIIHFFIIILIEGPKGKKRPAGITVTSKILNFLLYINNNLNKIYVSFSFIIILLLYLIEGSKKQYSRNKKIR